MNFFATCAIFVFAIGDTIEAPVTEVIVAESVVVISRPITILEPSKPFPRSIPDLCTPGTFSHDGCNSCYCSESMYYVRM